MTGGVLRESPSRHTRQVLVFLCRISRCSATWWVARERAQLAVPATRARTSLLGVLRWESLQLPVRVRRRDLHLTSVLSSRLFKAAVPPAFRDGLMGVYETLGLNAYAPDSTPLSCSLIRLHLVNHTF